MFPSSVISQASVLVGVKIRQYYPGYGKGEPQAQKAQHGWGVFGGEIVEVFEEDRCLASEAGKRVVLSLHYEDDDRDDVCFKQVTAVTRLKSDGGKGFIKAPVILEDNKQDKKVVSAVREMARKLEWKIEEKEGDLVREYARRCDILEEIQVMGPRKQAAKQKKRSRADQGDEKEDGTPNKKSKKANSPKEGSSTAEAEEIQRRPKLKKDSTVSRPKPVGAKVDVDPKEKSTTKAIHKVEEDAAKAKRSGAGKVTAAGDGDEVVTVGSDVSLICPISRKRIVRPCKGQDCQHTHCFDWKTFLGFVKKFNVTRVNMVVQTFATFSGISEERIKVTKVDEEERFTTRDKQKHNVAQIFLDIDLNDLKPSVREDEIVERVMNNAKDFIKTLKRIAVKSNDPEGEPVPAFAFVPDPEEKGARNLVFKRGEGTGFVLYIPMLMEQCPMQNCKFKVWNLREVTLMTELLKELKDEKELESVLVSRNYKRVDVKDSKDAPRSVPSVPRKRPKVEHFDLTDPTLEISAIPRCPKYDKNKVKTEPGVKTSSTAVPSASVLPAARSTLSGSLEPSQGSASTSLRSSSLLLLGARRTRSPPIDRLVEKPVADVVSKPKPWTDGVGTVRRMRQNNRGQWFGFIFRDDDPPQSKGLYVGEQAFGLAILNPAVVDRLLTNRQVVQFRVRSCLRQGKEALEAIDVKLWGTPNGMAESIATPHLDSGEGSATVESSAIEAAAETAPVQPEAQTISLKVLIGPEGSLLGMVDIVLEGEADARINEIVSDGFLKLTHTLPASELPDIEILKSLSWIEAACRQQNAQAHGLLDAAARWASDDLVALSDSHRDLLVLPKTGSTWPQVCAAQDAVGSTEDSEKGLFMLAVLNVSKEDASAVATEEQPEL
mmetsp:Transcript_24282/g.58177  ORF Transcript_24282/g.58177 Transcript_24282/m.58177 type:complete len:888 (-) Transcript_24282:2119-4782(-)|eukprot:CAMPEP_0169456226 /NCGR_PEP_ID=MMETSP1042-20121227/16236_1 /TAXON_ID=464988 /ORGANISM="Hemiselmis andersenii, Strain CCMP1180" /LENGTH=887 /DNA_ID=CAMNT_0009568427 /DNA_START=23 /DNA_END=2686 /DNA_ORIENTATION=+